MRDRDLFWDGGSTNYVVDNDIVPWYYGGRCVAIFIYIIVYRAFYLYGPGKNASSFHGLFFLNLYVYGLKTKFSYFYGLPSTLLGYSVSFPTCRYAKCLNCACALCLYHIRPSRDRGDQINRASSSCSCYWRRAVAMAAFLALRSDGRLKFVKAREISGAGSFLRIPDA
jgi:hypothetical protein